MHWCSIFALLSAAAATVANLCFRKVGTCQSSSRGYLVAYYLAACLIAWGIDGTLLTSTFSPSLFLIGGICGALNVALMFLISRGLHLGLSVTTFTFVSAASLVPSLILPFIFGENFGFFLSAGLFLGQCLLMAGLLWGFRGQTGEGKWGRYAVGLVLLQGSILCLIQWQTLATTPELPAHPFLFLSGLPEERIWFMPGMFTVAFCLQLGIFLHKEQRKPSLAEVTYGSVGGLSTAISTIFLLGAAAFASDGEQSFLFPSVAVATIVLGNLAVYLFYRDRINWRVNSLCSAGILLGNL